MLNPIYPVCSHFLTSLLLPMTQCRFLAHSRPLHGRLKGAVNRKEGNPTPKTGLRLRAATVYSIFVLVEKRQQERDFPATRLAEFQQVMV